MSYGIMCIERDKVYNQLNRLLSVINSDSSRLIRYHSELPGEEISYHSLCFYVERVLETRIKSSFEKTSSNVILLLFRIAENHRDWGESFLLVYEQYDMLQVIRDYVLTDNAYGLITGKRIETQEIKKFVDYVITFNNDNQTSNDDIETKLKEVDVNNELVDIYIQLKQLREPEELKTIYSLSLKNHVELLKKAIDVGLSKDNERVVKLYNVIKNTLLKTIKSEIDNTVEEQTTQLEKYKSKYL